MATVTRDLTDQIDGVRRVFSTPDAFTLGTLVVHLNGVRERMGVFFTETSPVAFETSEAPLPGDTLLVQYEIGTDIPIFGFPLVLASGSDPSRS